MSAVVMPFPVSRSAQERAANTDAFALFSSAHVSLRRSLRLLQSACLGLDRQSADVAEGSRISDVHALMQNAWEAMNEANGFLFEFPFGRSQPIDVLANSLCAELFDTMDILHLAVCATRGRKLPYSGTTCNPVFGALEIVTRRARTSERRMARFLKSAQKPGSTLL